MADGSEAHCPFPHRDGDGDIDGAGTGFGCPVPHDGAESAQAPHPMPVWAERAQAVVDDRTTVGAPASGLDTERARRMGRAVTEQRAGGDRIPEITEMFVNRLGKKLGYGHPLSDRTGSLTFTWTEAAEARLAEVPDFCRELTRWRVEWTAHKLGLGDVITPEVMDQKFAMWGAVSHRIQEREREGMPWTDAARSRFARIPDIVQGQVLEAVEGNARALGYAEVDDTVVDAVIERWVETGDFHEGRFGFR